MRSRSVTTFAVLLLGSIAVRSAAAQSAGDVVTATAAVDLKVEDAAVAAMSVGDALTVRKVQGKWLWVETAGGVRGWIDRKHITPAAPPRSPPERNETPVGG